MAQEILERLHHQLSGQHTAGPWHISGLPAMYQSECVVAEDGTCIATVHQPQARAGRPEPREVLLANASLIGVAPDLLAICQEIAGDPRVDLLDSERRIRLYAVLQRATRTV